jgi:hypothetical protein
MICVVDDLTDDYKPSRLVSGGAAFADHLAVNQYIYGGIPLLKLHLPTHFSILMDRFYQLIGVEDERSCAEVSNFYHREFSKKCQLDSLDEIGRAIANNAEVVVSNGFKARNTKIAEDADILVAFTFGRGERLKPGGSADTMRKYLALGKTQAIHVDLNDMSIYRGVVV